MVNLSSTVLFWARAEPERPALFYREQRLGYGELAARVAATAGSLRARGIGEGDIVALLMKNSAAFIELALAVSHLGAVLLPINYRLGADEVEYIVGHAGVKLLLADEELRGHRRRSRAIRQPPPRLRGRAGVVAAGAPA